jgi:hypothetical protein
MVELSSYGLQRKLAFCFLCSLSGSSYQILLAKIHHASKVKTMLNNVQFQPEAVESLKMKLRCLQECLENGIPFGVTGSPLSSLLAVQSDFLAILKETIKENKAEKRNPELVFEESRDCQEEGTGFLDIDTEEEYIPVSDPLGNPLQVQIDLGKSYLFTSEEINQLEILIEFLESFFATLSLGQFDQLFIQNLIKFFQTNISSFNLENQENKIDKTNRPTRKQRLEYAKAVSHFKLWRRGSINQSSVNKKVIRQGAKAELLNFTEFLQHERAVGVLADSPSPWCLEPIGAKVFRIHRYQMLHFPKCARDFMIDVVDLSPDDIRNYEESISRIRKQWHSDM